MTFAPRTWAVGEVVPAAIMNTEIRDQFNSMFAAWTSYTPVWTAATTNPVIGNGVILGRYMKIGRTVLGHINVTMGSTTTYGAGDYSFTLPAAGAASGASLIGAAQLLAGSRWAGHVVLGSGGSTLSPFFSTTSTDTRLAWMGPTVPVTLAATHQLRMTFIQETAT
ncbi:hypothetical protein [Streptomyces sp. NBC_00620]|uniref:hypothetical protein n=1 Tax=Streptomyces sp. NBC_00620 TaxID=2903666 RepID=UPI00224EE6A2|nr:hypothetical protein [Streptomyces sp. NBC_00620]MCX4974209.1 hypothetical protein [Streptomyces sp. NBC_00620]